MQLFCVDNQDGLTFSAHCTFTTQEIDAGGSPALYLATLAFSPDATLGSPPPFDPLEWAVVGSPGFPISPGLVTTVNIFAGAPGVYLAMLVISSSQRTFSQLAPVLVSSSADSLHEQLQAQTVVRLQSLNLPGGPGIRRITMPEENRITGVVTIPAILVTTWKQSEEYPESGTNARDDTMLPILIAFVDEKLNEPDTLDTQFTFWREKIRRSFREDQRLPVAGHYQTKIGPGPIVDVAFSETNYRASTMVLRCYVREPRGLGA